MKIWSFQHFISDEICWFALKLSGLINEIKSIKWIPQLVFFLFIAMITTNMLFSFFVVTLIIVKQGEKSFIYFTQDIKLINFNKIQDKMITP